LRSVLQDKDVAQGRLQGEQVRPGGPQQVGKYPTDLAHVLNQAKFVGISSRGPDVFGLQDKDVAQGRLQGEQVGPGGPQQVGKHPTDLGHVLNQAKVES